MAETSRRCLVSTHSRLKAAGFGADDDFGIRTVSTHSRLKAAGFENEGWGGQRWFQHTAA